uniref:Uncharacterized protein n=1 Tax=Schistocephalus solidus TaxID=70667 RepID=A0A0X3Q2R4_SCHSO
MSIIKAISICAYRSGIGSHMRKPMRFLIFQPGTNPSRGLVFMMHFAGINADLTVAHGTLAPSLSATWAHRHLPMILQAGHYLLAGLLDLHQVIFHAAVGLVFQVNQTLLHNALEVGVGDFFRRHGSPPAKHWSACGSAVRHGLVLGLGLIGGLVLCSASEAAFGQSEDSQQN